MKEINRSSSSSSASVTGGSGAGSGCDYMELGLMCMTRNQLTAAAEIVGVGGLLTFLSHAESSRVWTTRPDIAMVEFKGAAQLEDVLKVEIVQRLFHGQKLTVGDIKRIESHSPALSIVHAALQRSEQSVCAILAGPLVYANNVCDRHGHLSPTPTLHSAESIVVQLRQLGKHIGTAKQIQALARWVGAHLSGVSVRGRFTEMGVHYGVCKSDTAAKHVCVVEGCTRSALMPEDGASSQDSSSSQDSKGSNESEYLPEVTG